MFYMIIITYSVVVTTATYMSNICSVIATIFHIRSFFVDIEVSTVSEKNDCAKTVEILKYHSDFEMVHIKF